MGSPGFAVPALWALVAAGHEIAAVYTQPPRPAGRGGRVRLRDAAPGLTVAATAGYAFSERTVRGRVEAEEKLGREGGR